MTDNNKVSKEDILRKLQKLQVMAERGTEHEATMAKSLIDSIVEKYEIDMENLEELQERKVFRLIYTRGTRHQVVRLLAYLDLKACLTRRRYEIIITATDQEWEIFNKFYNEILALWSRRREKLELELSSYMLGYVAKAYPVVREPLCPKCGKKLEYAGRRYYCLGCGYKSRALKPISINPSAYAEGQSSSQRLLESVER